MIKEIEKHNVIGVLKCRKCKKEIHQGDHEQIERIVAYANAKGWKVDTTIGVLCPNCVAEIQGTPIMDEEEITNIKDVGNESNKSTK